MSGAGKPRGINVNAVPSKGTFRSSICLSEGAAPTAQSTYGQVHGASMPQLMQAVRTTAQQHAEVTKFPNKPCKSKPELTSAWLFGPPQMEQSYVSTTLHADEVVSA